MTNSVADWAAGRARPKKYPPVKRFHKAIKRVSILETNISLVKGCLVAYQNCGFTNDDPFVTTTPLL
jgi:hypothetical protein